MTEQVALDPDLATASATTNDEKIESGPVSVGDDVKTLAIIEKEEDVQKELTNISPLLGK